MAEADKAGFVSPFVDRLRQAMGSTSQAVVAKRADVSTSAMTRYMQGSIPGVDVAARLARVCGVSLEWLATGDGVPNGARAGFAEVPILDVRLAAGGGELTETAQQIGTMPFDYGLLRSLGRSSAEGLVVLEADGDSMEPLIADGARVLADTRDIRLREGVFGFRMGDELRVKRLRKRGEGVEVISENSHYEPELLVGEALNDFAILGRVLWSASPL